MNIRIGYLQTENTNHIKAAQVASSLKFGEITKLVPTNIAKEIVDSILTNKLACGVVTIRGS